MNTCFDKSNWNGCPKKKQLEWLPSKKKATGMVFKVQDIKPQVDPINALYI